MSDGEAVLTVCRVCGARYLHTVLVACADCGAPFAGTLLEPGGDEVGYDLSDWGPSERADLVAAMGAVPHRWEGDELVVREPDADHVEDLIDGVDHPDALEEEDDDGGAGALALSAFYVAADVLQHDAGNPGAVAELLGAVEVAPRGAPYGIDPDTWGDVLALAGALADRLADGADDDDVEAAAAALRQVVRPLV